MFCQKCGKEIGENVRFCPECGTPNNTTSSTIPESIILAKSKSAKARFDEHIKNSAKQFSGLTWSLIGIPLFFFIILPLILEMSDEAPISYPPFLIFLMIICVILAFILIFSSGKKEARLAEVFNEFVAKENLTVCSDKVFGFSSDGEFSLTYENIKNCYITTSQTILEDKDSCGFTNDFLFITDTEHHTHTFRSFSNCNELSSIIKEQMKNSRF